VLSRLNAEKKFFDTAISFNADATGEIGNNTNLCLIPQGVTESTRVGRKCTLKSIQLRLTLIYVPAADTVGADTVTLYLIQDQQANGAVPAFTEMFTSTNMIVAVNNLANSERFRTLGRWCFRFQAGAGIQGAFGRDVQTLEWFKKLNMPLEFSGATGAITELKSNNMYLVAGTGGGSDDLVSIQGTVRLRFSDV